MVSYGLAVAERVIALLIPASAAFPAAFLGPAIVGRLATMLNYFLRHLTGPDRAKLKIADMSRVRHPCCCRQSVFCSSASSFSSVL